MAAETFMRNLVNPNFSDHEWADFLKLHPSEQLQSKLIVGDISKAYAMKKMGQFLKETDVDLVSGGPPCQGFSLAGRRNHEDSRNELPKEFLKYVKKSSPKMVVIENVLGMNLKFKAQETQADSAFNQVAKALENTGPGYTVQKLLLNAKHYGAAQSRERLFLIGIRKDLASCLNIEATKQVWKSRFKDELLEQQPDLAPPPKTFADQAATVADAFADLIEENKTSTYVKHLRDSKFWGLVHEGGRHNHVERNHTFDTISKFELYILLHKHGLKNLLLRQGHSDKFTTSRALEFEIARKVLRFPILTTDGKVLARDFAEFKSLANRFATFKHSQRVLSLEHVSPTVITSPDDFIHPLAPRVLTVREMARLQGFPEQFKFFAKETTGGLKRRTEVPQYSQVGNAVSPFVSLAIGELVKSILSRQNEA
jgi:DNA (cytosine-5)-methyltransferase 1